MRGRNGLEMFWCQIGTGEEFCVVAVSLQLVWAVVLARYKVPYRHLLPWPRRVTQAAISAQGEIDNDEFGRVSGPIHDEYLTRRVDLLSLARKETE